MEKPYFSIIIPVYNREKTVSRAIESCIERQSFQDYEIIVVDDKSTDRSIDIVSSYEDERIVLLKHDINRGVCPARNTGIDVASGQWIIFLDSDDALVSESLEIIYQHTLGLDKNIGQVAFNNRYENGDISPDPPLANEIWDYPRYIEWASKVTGRSDVMNCIRRTVFDVVKFPNSQALESAFHLDMAKRFNTKTVPYVGYLVYQDADNQITRSDNESRRKFAPDRACAINEILNNHGRALKKYGPAKFWNFVGAAATNWYLAGDRYRGARYAIHYLNHHPLNSRMWIILMAGLGGSHFLQFVLDMKQRCRSCCKNRKCCT